MSFLIDTHAFLWFTESSTQLSRKATLLIEQTPSVYVSIVSLWEIAIKQNVGKLELNYSLEQYVTDWKLSNGHILDLSTNDIYTYQSLLLHHRDPFDRMLIAQAITNNLPIISADTKFDLYNEIERVW